MGFAQFSRERTSTCNPVFSPEQKPSNAVESPSAWSCLTQSDNLKSVAQCNGMKGNLGKIRHGPYLVAKVHGVHANLHRACAANISQPSGVASSPYKRRYSSGHYCFNSLGFLELKHCRLFQHVPPCSTGFPPQSHLDDTPAVEA